MSCLPGLARGLVVTFVVSLVAARSSAQTADAAASVTACVDAFRRAQDRRDEGQPRTARAEVERCAEEHCPELVRRKCREWLPGAHAAVPTAVVRAVDELGRARRDAALALDGAPLAPDEAGRTLELEAGPHLATASSGDVVAELRFTLMPGEKLHPVVLVLPALRAAESRDSGSASSEVPYGPRAAGDSDPRSARVGVAPSSAIESSSRREPAAWRTPLAGTAFGVGGAALVAATITGVLALRAGDALAERCAAVTGCTSDELDAAYRLGHASTGLFVVAGLGLATGTVALTLPWR